VCHLLDTNIAMHLIKDLVGRTSVRTTSSKIKERVTTFSNRIRKYVLQISPNLISTETIKQKPKTHSIPSIILWSRLNHPKEGEDLLPTVLVRKCIRGEREAIRVSTIQVSVRVMENQISPGDNSIGTGIKDRTIKMGNTKSSPQEDKTDHSLSSPRKTDSQDHFMVSPRKTDSQDHFMVSLKKTDSPDHSMVSLRKTDSQDHSRRLSFCPRRRPSIW